MGRVVQGTSLSISRMCVLGISKAGQTKLFFEKECDIVKKLKQQQQHMLWSSKEKSELY